jgi:hypothetical protein
MSISCKYCGNPIVFDDSVLSKNGRRIPLQEWNGKPHDCQFNPYKKARANSMVRRETRKIEEYEIIDELKNKVAATNNRLENYELELVVRRSSR